MNEEKTFEEKVKILNKLHTGSHPDAKNLISQWEDKFARLSAQKDWLDHPNTKEVRDLAMEQIEAIEGILSDREDLSEADRKALFAQKKAHRVYLSVLSGNPLSEMKSIESSVDLELQSHE